MSKHNCYTCEKSLIKNHTSWFCNEECKKDYWGDNYFPEAKTAEQFKEKMQIVKNKSLGKLNLGY